MALVIRTEAACRPPTNVSKKTLLYGSDAKGGRRDEKSLYEEHREKDVWSRGGRNGAGHITLLYKKSWGDTGDDEVYEIARSAKPRTSQREPQRPVTPTRLQRDFLYPPSRKPLGKFHPPHCKECRAAARQAKNISADAPDSAPLEQVTEQQLSHARHVLRDVWVTDLSLQRNQDNVLKMVTILKRQSRQRDVDEFTEALAVLTRWSGQRSEVKEAHNSRPASAPPPPVDTSLSTRRKRAQLLIRPVQESSPIRSIASQSPRHASPPRQSVVSGRALQVTSAAPSQATASPMSGRQRRHPRRSVVPSAEQALAAAASAAAAAGLSTSPEHWAEMAAIDFYGKALYRQKQQQREATAEAGVDGGPRTGGGRRRSRVGTPGFEDSAAGGAARRWRHRPVCSLHPDNVHPSFKTASLKSSFSFPRDALRLSASRVAAVREGAMFVPPTSDGANEGSTDRNFPPCTLARAEKARKDRRRLQQQEHRQRQLQWRTDQGDVSSDMQRRGSAASVDTVSARPLSCPPLASSAPESTVSTPVNERCTADAATIGALIAAAASVVVPPAVALSCDEQPALGCGEQSSDDEAAEGRGPLGRVQGWRREWHRMRARLDHDLSTLLHGRATARRAVCGDAPRLAEVMKRAQRAGEAWARCRRRPQSGRAPPLPGSGPATQPPPRDRPVSCDAVDVCPTDVGEARATCVQLTAVLNDAASRLWACVDVLGTREDTPGFRRRASDQIGVGSRAAQDLAAAAASLRSHLPSLPAYAPTPQAFSDAPTSPRLQAVRVEAEKALSAAVTARRSFGKVSTIFGATADRRSAADVVVRPRSAMDWGRSIWDEAHDDIGTRRAQVARAAALYARVCDQCLQQGLPENSEQENYLYLLRELLRDPSCALGPPLFISLLSRAGTAALLDKGTQRISGFVRDELGLTQREVADMLSKRGLQQLTHGPAQDLAPLSPATEPPAGAFLTKSAPDHRTDSRRATLVEPGRLPPRP